MKVRSLFPVLLSLALPMTSAIAQSTQVGTILVKQNDSGNNATSVSFTVTPGSSDQVNPVSGNRGDFDMSFGNQIDPAVGTLVTAVAENTRDNTAFGDNASTVGRFAATACVDIADHPTTRFERYFIPVNSSPQNAEVNINIATGFFPYSRWLGGFARNAAGVNGGITDELRSHASIRLGTEFKTLGSGVFRLDLRNVGGHTSQNGVVLISHAKNEANYATARANSDGTFNMFVRDNAATGAANEQDPISFVYLPSSALNTDGLITLGRVKGSAATAVLAGPAQVTKGTTGRWYITIPGHSPDTGTLLVSPEGADTNNFDNIVSYQWDAANSRYIVESRDIEAIPDPVPVPAIIPGLQNSGTAEDIFSFAFFKKLKAPQVTLLTPVPGDHLVAPGSIQMTASASDLDGTVTRVEFLMNGVVVASDTEAPYEHAISGLEAGNYRIAARAIDDNLVTVTTPEVEMTVVASAANPLQNPALWLNGVNENANLGNGAELRLGAAPNNGFTLECWFRKEGRRMQDSPGIGRMLPLIVKGRDLAEAANVTGSTADINYAFGLTSGGLLTALFETYPTAFYTDPPNTNNGGKDVFATATHAPIVDGQWHHAAVTYDVPTSTFAFYLDGAPAGTVVAKVDGVQTLNVYPRYDNVSPVGIGTAFNNGGTAEGAFPGVVDEVRLWNRVRPAAAIQAFKNASVAQAEGLVGRFGFDEGQGNQVASTSGVRTRGTLANEPAWAEGPALTSQAPQVVIAHPMAGARFAPGSTILLAATGVDKDGSIVKVEFFDGTIKIGEATSAPFVFNWVGASTTSHTLTALATDDSGLTTISEPVTLQVAAISPLMISEVHSAQSPTSPAGVADYWELINTSSSTFDVAGYTWDDSRGNYNTAKAWALPAATVLAAGESVIFTKADPVVFRAWWGLSTSVRVFRSTGSPDLDANDSIILYNNTGVVVTRLSYAVGGFNRVNGLPSLGGQAGESAGGVATASLIWDPAFGLVSPRYSFSSAGVKGGSQAVTGADLGSPGGIGGVIEEPATVLALGVAPKTFLENAPSPSAIGTLIRSGDTSTALEVSLTSSNIAEATVPATVTLQPGQSAVTFNVTAVDDYVVDGTKSVQLVALAPGVTLACQEVFVLDDGDLPPPDLRVTEIQSSQSASAPAGAADYFEVTNFSSRTVSMDGYTWDDSRKDAVAAQAWKLPAGSSIAAGESVILTAMDPTAFRAWWGLGDQVKVWQTPGAPDLDINDSISLFTNHNIEVFTFSYAASGFTRTFNVPSRGGHAGPSAGATEDSTALVYDPASTSAARRYLSANIYRLGGRAAATGTDIGSPGVINGAPLAVPSPTIANAGPLQFTHVSTVSLTGSEISAYDSGSKRLFVTSNAGLQILAMTDPALPVNLGTLDFTLAPFNLSSKDVTSVASRNGVVAVAVPNAVKDQPGSVVFFTASTGALLKVVTVGVLPDMITYSPNGNLVLTANEGEMSSPNLDTAPGSVSIIDVTSGYTNPPVTTVGFTAFDSQAAALKAQGVRIFEASPGVLKLPSIDFEPEYIAVSPDNLRAMVTLQEANAVALLDLTTKTFTAIKPLGEKDFSSLLADFSDPDGPEDGPAINLTRDNHVFGLYMPDAITSFQANRQTYYVTANEGDDRNDFMDPAETTTVGNSSYVLDPVVFPNAEALKANNRLGRLTVSNAPGLRGDTNGDGTIDKILAYGGRSISILNAAGEIVYDSGDLIERQLASLGAPWFDDGRSDNKASEPEGVTLGEIDGRRYVFVALERARGVMVFDITDPTHVAQAGFVGLSADQNPEGITFIAAAQSPNGKPMLAVTNETSNTLTLYNVGRFTLQLLHYGDAEGDVLSLQTAPNLAALVDAFEDGYANTLIVAGGDSFIPGAFLTAGADSALNSVAGIGLTATGRPDIAIANFIGVEAAAIGSHEFDLGSNVFANSLRAEGAWTGAQFPLLALNLDYSGNAALNSLAVNVPLDAATTAVPAATAQNGKLVPVSVVTKGGEKIGLVGVTTQLLASLGQLEGASVKGGNVKNLDLLAGQIQPYINELRADGINKIVLLSHLRGLADEQALAGKLVGVDIIVASGSHTLLGDSNDAAVSWSGHGDSFIGSYPLLAQDQEGTPVLIVSTDSEHTYLGRLVVDFDLTGKIVVQSLPDHVIESGAYASTSANVAAAWGVTEANLATTAFAAGTKGTKVKAVTTAISAVQATKDRVVYGYTAVHLEGTAAVVRSQETNLGDLTADANQNAARKSVGGSEAIVSIKHAGGITGPIGAVTETNGVIKKGPPLGYAATGKMTGAISQLDIENALRGNQKLMVFETTPAGLKAILEHGLANGAGQSQFPQVGGVQFAWNPDLPVGSRVVSMALLRDDGTAGAPIYKAGSLGNGMLPGAPAVIKVVTLNMLANGGEGYPMKANGENFQYVLTDGTLGAVIADENSDFTVSPQLPANAEGEQLALAQHVNGKHGNLAQAYRIMETGTAQDERIQNLKQRIDTVPPVAGQDSDGDGLSDLEELILGASRDTVLRVGDRVDLNLSAFLGAGQTLKIVGKLPPGLKFDPLTGQLTGVLAGNAALYDLQIQIMEGKFPVKAFNLQLDVEAFPARLLAGYEALLEDANGKPQGIVRLAVTKAGQWTGSLDMLNAPRRASKGTFQLVAGRQRAEVRMVFAGKEPLKEAVILLNVDAETALLSGSYTAGTVNGSLRGFRLVSMGGSPPTVRKLNLAMDAGVQDGIAYPAGLGWAKGTVTTKGAVSLKGQMGDAQAVTLAAYLGATGQALVWVQPYKNKIDSFYGGVMALPNVGQPAATLDQLVPGTWWFKAADAKELSYEAGFAEPLAVKAIVTPFDIVKTSSELADTLGLTGAKLQVEIEGGGLSNAADAPVILPTEFTLGTTFALSTSAPVTGPPVLWAGKVNKADGSVTGTLTLPANSNILAGKATVSGVLLQGLSDDVVGAGFIRVPVPGKKGLFRTSSLLLEK